MKALAVILFPLTFFFITACHNTNENKMSVAKDSIKYLSLSALDTLEYIKDNLQQGRMYLFKIQGQSFRLRYDSSGSFSDVYAVEKNRNGEWKRNAWIPFGDELSFSDINGDGFPDFASQYQSHSSEVYYDPSKHQFDSTEWTMPADDDEIIDSARNIHFNYKGVYHGCDQPISELYTCKGIKPFFYYELEFDRECLADKISRIRLFQFEKGTDTLFHLVKTISTKDPTHFDYKNYWKKNYKQLLAEYK